MGDWGFEVNGFSEFKESLARKTEAVDKGVQRAVGLAALELEAGAKAQFGQSHPAGTQTPSSPGSPPAVVTGSLRRSFHTEGPVRIGFGRYQAMVGPSMVYARIQELGGQAGVNHATTLPARPSFSAAYAEWRDKDVLWNRAAEAVKAGLNI